MKQRFSFPLLKAERGSSFSSYLIRSAAPRHCLFLPGAARRPPPASAYFAQQIFEGNTCPNLSSNPPVASNVTLDSFITLSASTEWNCIQNPTREEKIKSTEQAFLKQGSQWKKTQNRATVGSQQQYNCSQLQRISIQLSKRIWQMSKRNDTVVYFCGKKQTG